MAFSSTVVDRTNDAVLIMAMKAPGLGNMQRRSTCFDFILNQINHIFLRRNVLMQDFAATETKSKVMMVSIRCILINDESS